MKRIPKDKTHRRLNVNNKEIKWKRNKPKEDYFINPTILCQENLVLNQLRLNIYSVRSRNKPKEDKVIPDPIAVQKWKL